MAKCRLLPEAAYDFFTRDGRDGEEGERRDTMAEAREDARKLRAAMPSYKRPAIEVWWRINERKVLRLLDRVADEAAAAATGNLPVGY